MMKRLICLIMILLFLTPAAFAAEEKLTFYMEGATGNVGDTVTVVGAVKNAPVCASFRVILTYDESVLEPVKCSKLECKGLFMQNINATYQGKKAVNVLSADAQNALSGDMKLFSLEFKIVGETPENDGTLISVAHQEFFDATPERVYPVVQPCRIYVGSDAPATTPDTDATTPEDTTSPEDTTPPEDATPEDTTTPENATTPEEPKEDSDKGDKAPTGNWIVDESNGDLYHVDESGTTNIYVPEYVEKPEPGKVTEVILKDKETGEEAGSIKVEGTEDGSFKVVAQDLIKDRKAGFPVWGWVLIGVATVAAAGVAGYFLISRKKTAAK